MIRGRLQTLSEHVSSLKLELLKDSSPLVIGLFSIMFGLFATEAIQRAMEQLLSSGVASLRAEGLLSFAARITSLVVCALSMCIFFIHSAVAIIRLRLEGPLPIIYLKFFYVFYLTLTPWVSLHLARIVGTMGMSRWRDADLWVDVVFISLYGAGLLGLQALLGLIAALRKRLAGRLPQANA